MQYRNVIRVISHNLQPSLTCLTHLQRVLCIDMGAAAIQKAAEWHAARAGVQQTVLQMSSCGAGNFMHKIGLLRAEAEAVAEARCYAA